MIEGIGHEAGLFEPMSTILDFASVFHCYGENNIPLFGDTNCVLNLEREELLTQVNEVSIYPNPTSGKCKINASGLDNAIQSYDVIDIYGKVIVKQNVQLLNNTMFEIDLKKCSPGIYFVRLYSENQGVIFEKIVIS